MLIKDEPIILMKGVTMNRMIRILPSSMIALMISALSWSQVDAGVQPQTTDLAIQVSSSEPTIPAPGSLITFTVKVGNLGPEGSFLPSHAMVTLPSEYTDISWSCVPSPPTPPSQISLSSCPNPSTGIGNLDLDVGLSANTSVTFTFKVKVPENASSILIFAASVAPPGWVTDSNPTNNKGGVGLLKGADVGISLRTAPNPSKGQDPVTVLATVCNGGPYPAENVNAKVTSSQEVTVSNAVSGEGWQCSVINQQALCQRPTLPVGHCSTIQMVVVPSSGLELVQVQGSVSTAGKTKDPNPENDTVKHQFGVGKGDQVSLVGGGWSCALQNANQSTGFLETLGMFSCFSLLAAAYRISRRRQGVE